MKTAIRSALPALVAGALFGVGLAVSGMTKPAKVIGFLDVFGAWDASLVFVMMGAIAVHLIAYRWIRGRSTPLFAQKFALPTRRDIDLRLVAGAALFGVGWGIGGYCPGPALTSLGTGATGVVAFVAAMMLGMTLAARAETKLADYERSERRKSQAPSHPRNPQALRLSALGADPASSGGDPTGDDRPRRR